MENGKEQTSKAMDALLEEMDSNEEYQMQKQAILDEHDAQATAPEITPAPAPKRGAKIIKAVARPILHIAAELFGTGALGIALMLGVAIVLLTAMLAVAWIAQAAGIPPNSAQEVVLVIATGGAAIYAFAAETKRLSRKLREWTDTLHRQIEGV